MLTLPNSFYSKSYNIKGCKRYKTAQARQAKHAIAVEVKRSQ